jgi:hypothetical protein
MSADAPTNTDLPIAIQPTVVEPIRALTGTVGVTDRRVSVKPQTACAAAIRNCLLCT